MCPAGKSLYRKGASNVANGYAGEHFPGAKRDCASKRLDRLTLRGRAKVNGRWLLFCLVHNIEKLTHAGYAA